MHDFEFQRYVTVGQYLATGSPLHHLDPRTRLVSSAFLLVAITAAPHLSGLGLALVITFLALIAARVPLGYALRGLLAPLPF
ncbi:MAG: energy-coupling factor transporter transmembrane protein EcfT, partial [Anaerolineae bacterium]|nr:energy-coupling factor transporter transmembrane protein EcfT [Anaerolineae bacterium]